MLIFLLSIIKTLQKPKKVHFFRIFLVPWYYFSINVQFLILFSQESRKEQNSSQVLVPRGVLYLGFVFCQKRLLCVLIDNSELSISFLRMVSSEFFNFRCAKNKCKNGPAQAHVLFNFFP